MSSEVFDLVFSGELVRGANLQQSKLNLGKLFKISDAKVDALFSGESIVLKKGLDFAAANKYRVAIKKAGCRVDLVEKKDVASPVQKADPVVSSPVEKVVERNQELPTEQRAMATDFVNSKRVEPKSESALPLPEVHEQVYEESDQSSRDDSSLQLAPAGAPVLAAEERERIVPVQVNTSQIELRELGGELLDENEKAEEVAFLKPSLEVDLAPVGASLVSEDEKDEPVVKKVDISALTLSAPGGDLGQLKEEKEVSVPDISHLSLD